jgi:hypothetical protein
MITFAALPPHSTQEIRQEYELTGDTARLLMHNYEIAMNQWRDRPSALLEQPMNESIQRVPFRKVGTVKFRFQQARPMQPRHIQTESDSGNG